MKISNRGKQEQAMGDFPTIPPGRYHVVIMDYEEKQVQNGPNAGSPRVSLMCEIFGSQNNQDGEKVFHSVTFLDTGKKGSGFSVHFMHTIGVKCDCDKCDPEKKIKDLDIDFHDWIGKVFDADVIEKQIFSGAYGTRGEQLFKKVNNIAQIYKSDAKPPEVKKAEKKEGDEEIPF